MISDLCGVSILFSIGKIEFIFVDTADKRCQVPSNKLIRDAAAIFVEYD